MAAAMLFMPGIIAEPKRKRIATDGHLGKLRCAKNAVQRSGCCDGPMTTALRSIAVWVRRGGCSVARAHRRIFGDLWSFLEVFNPSPAGSSAKDHALPA